MKQFKTYLLLSLSLLFFAGCGASSAYLQPNTRIEGKNLSFLMPEGAFRVLWGGFYESSPGREIMEMVREFPGERYTLSISDYSEHAKHTPVKLYQFLYNSKASNFSKYIAVEYTKYKKGKSPYTRHFYTGYYKGLKCYKEDSFMRAFSPYTKTNKNTNYSMRCGYYDKAGMKHILTYHGRVQANTKKGYVPSYKVSCKAGKCDYVKLMSDDFKRKASHILDSLVIKNIDIERMKREGLYHPGKGMRFKHSPR